MFRRYSHRILSVLREISDSCRKFIYCVDYCSSQNFDITWTVEVLRYMKKNLNNALLGNLNISLDDEALNMMICSETEDHKSAVKAFINKSKPTFKGK